MRWSLLVLAVAFPLASPLACWADKDGRLRRRDNDRARNAQAIVSLKQNLLRRVCRNAQRHLTDQLAAIRI